MIVFGYAKQVRYTNDGTLMVQVRIPNIHGPYIKAHYNGKQIKGYVDDTNLPYYPSLILPKLPNEGEVVALSSVNERDYDFIIIGLTGGSYQNGYEIRL